MVEVFSTNVDNQKQADYLLHQIGLAFPAFEINFDLEDCDHILRVKSNSLTIDGFQIIALLNNLGFNAKVLSDHPICSDVLSPMEISYNTIDKRL